MQTDYKNSSNKSGVYKITNLINSKVYIGSAKNFKKRFYQHIKSLIKGKHSNKHLQNAFNQDGTENFLFEVIEVLEDSIKEYRFQIEQEYINEYLDRWEDCYNFKKETIQKERSCHSLTPEETSNKKSESQKNVWDSYSDEERENRINLIKEIGFNNKGKIRTEEMLVNFSIAAKGRWENNKTKMLDVVNANLIKAREKIDYKKIAESKQKTFSLVDPTGNKVEIKGINNFCKENNIPYVQFWRLINKQRPNYKGWTLCHI
jgi:group I intron endonuclease